MVSHEHADLGAAGRCDPEEGAVAHALLDLDGAVEEGESGRRVAQVVRRHDGELTADVTYGSVVTVTVPRVAT